MSDQDNNQAEDQTTPATETQTDTSQDSQTVTASDVGNLSDVLSTDQTATVDSPTNAEADAGAQDVPAVDAADVAVAEEAPTDATAVVESASTTDAPVAQDQPTEETPVITTQDVSAPAVESEAAATPEVPADTPVAETAVDATPVESAPAVETPATPEQQEQLSADLSQEVQDQTTSTLSESQDETPVQTPEAGEAPAEQASQAVDVPAVVTEVTTEVPVVQDAPVEEAPAPVVDAVPETPVVTDPVVQPVVQETAPEVAESSPVVVQTGITDEPVELPIAAVEDAYITPPALAPEVVYTTTPIAAEQGGGFLIDAGNGAAPAVLEPTPLPPVGVSLEAINAEVVSAVHTELERLLEGVSDIQRQPFTQIATYLDVLAPKKPVDIEIGKTQQRTLYRALSQILNHTDEEDTFSQRFTALLKVFHLARDAALHENEVFRFLEFIELRGEDIRAFTNFLDLLKLTADPQTRALHVQQIDFQKALQFGLTDVARQRIISFYGL